MPKYGKRISKRRDPWYNKWLHYGKQYAAGAAGAGLGFIYGNLPGAYSGYRAGTAFVGKYRRPIRARLASRSWKSWETGSNRGPVFGSNPPPSNGGTVARKKKFGRRIFHRPGVRHPRKYVFFK